MKRQTIGSAVLISAILFMLLGAAPVSGSAVPTDSQGQPLWEVRQWTDFPVRIPVSDPAQLQRLLAAVPLAGFNREGLAPDGSLSVRITAAEAAALTAAGVSYITLPDLEKEGRQRVEQDWALRYAAGESAQWPVDKAAGSALTYYPTHAEVGTLLADLAAAYPDLCRTFSWGQSVQGRELWGLVVSAGVDTTAAEPEVRLSSTVHGNEVVGMVLLLDLAQYLVQNYGQAGFAEVTNLVDETEIHIMPLHNPDGYVAATRYNASAVDLNRNYPLPAGTHLVQEIETLNFMDYANAHHFVISENGHGGALVVNYPWDYTFSLAPDDAAAIQLSLAYSTWNLPMFNGPFPDGITNGADWYVADGTIQDWAYDQTGCLDVTIELGIAKWPGAASLVSYWDDNRESLLHFVAAARYGVNGVVTDATTGAPLDAEMRVTGNSKSVRTDPAHGDYYKLLDTGTYELVFSADGYDTVTVSNVATVWGTPTVVDVQMTMAGVGVPPLPTRPTLTAWPNPFNPGTQLTVTVPVSGLVRLGVYDLRGRLVRSLLEVEAAAGPLPVLWDGRDERGSSLPSGVYFGRAQSAAGSATVKLVLLK